MIDSYLQFSKILVGKRHQYVWYAQNKIDYQTNNENSIQIVFKKFMVAISFTNMPHNFAVHAAIENKGVYPTSFYC